MNNANITKNDSKTQTTPLKQIHVSAAVIFRTAAGGEKMVFATQRGYGEWKDWWEFPGGKIEDGESAEQAVVREIREELATEIRAERKVCTVEYDYPAFHLTMECFLCSIVSGKLTLLEHENAAWLSEEKRKMASCGCGSFRKSKGTFLGGCGSAGSNAGGSPNEVRTARSKLRT